MLFHCLDRFLRIKTSLAKNKAVTVLASSTVTDFGYRQKLIFGPQIKETILVITRLFRIFWPIPKAPDFGYEAVP